MRIEFVEASSSKSEITMKFVHLPAGFGCDEFWMSVTPVTEAQWAEVMENSFNTSQKPKLNITFVEAQEFCKKLGPDYRLPTEIEWCRAVGIEPVGLEKYAVFGQNECPQVGTKLPNEYGIYDMRGLCWEWLDSGSENLRHLRGGSWYSLQVNARAVYRANFHPADRLNGFGFRVLCCRPLQESKCQPFI